MRYAQVIALVFVFAAAGVAQAVECSRCGGKGKVEGKCPECKGKGELCCPKCGGTGGIQVAAGRVIRCLPCPDCKAKDKPSKWPCPRCKGTGKAMVPCPKCGGKGRIEEVAVDRASELRGVIRSANRNLQTALAKIRQYEDDLREKEVKVWRERAERYRMTVTRATILLAVAENREASLTAADQLQLAEERVKKAEAELAAAKKALEETKKLAAEGQPEPR